MRARTAAAGGLVVAGLVVAGVLIGNSRPAPVDEPGTVWPVVSRGTVIVMPEDLDTGR